MNHGTYTAEDFRYAMSWASSPVTREALHIAARVMTPGLLDDLIADNCDKLANKAADTIRAALTQPDHPNAR